jgi:hypothetical protein
MPLVRLSMACLAALTCLGTSYAAAGKPIPGPVSKPAGGLTVEICAGDVKRGLCGPTAFSGGRVGDGFPAIAKQAGSISAPSVDIKCPGVCGYNERRRPKTVTIRAWPRRDGYHEFDHWDGACRGTVPTCTVPFKGNLTVKAVFRTDT